VDQILKIVAVERDDILHADTHFCNVPFSHIMHKCHEEQIVLGSYSPYLCLCYNLYGPKSSLLLHTMPVLLHSQPFGLMGCFQPQTIPEQMGQNYVDTVQHCLQTVVG